ncbi:MAG: glycosyltransferase family 2 protein [Leuconostoc pseudomesenteroides]|uniref:glycosyltransferase family 2 protein n=1 Tax=Leuconostoc pseudomesenteroides TaxID=33968 RepID=UPI0039E7FEC8
MKNNYVKESAFVILNYQKFQLTLNLVKQLVTNLNVDEKQIIVVDNLSPNNSDEILRKKLPSGVTYIQSGYNGGYAFGNNIGIRKAINMKFEFITLLNNDIFFHDDFVSPLIEAIRRNAKIAMAGPVYYTDDGKVNSYGGVNDFIRGRTKFVDVDSVPENLDIIKFEWILGAVLTFKSSLIKSIGYIPEEYFLNYEENDWQQIARRQGYNVVVVKKSKIVHEAGSTIRSISGLQEYYMLRNKIIFELRNAKWYQKSIFWFYLAAGTLKSIVANKKNIKRIPIYIDGIFSRNRYVDKQE